jgi:superoxide dismutase, Cu-Zn family
MPWPRSEQSAYAHISGERLMKGFLIGAACLMASAAPSFAEAPQMAKGDFIDAKGQKVGGASLIQTQGGVLIKLEIAGLPAGEHGFHIHETGKCEPNTKFESAGDHFDSDSHKHGYLTAGGPHIGDMPNQFVGQDGKLHAEVINPNVTLGSGAASLFDQDGSAIVVHAKADDHRSQPSGEAGDRLACAVVQKQ